MDSKPLCFGMVSPFFLPELSFRCGFSPTTEVTPTAPTRALQLEPTAWVRVALEVPKKAPTKVWETQILRGFTNESMGWVAGDLVVKGPLGCEYVWE